MLRYLKLVSSIFLSLGLALSVLPAVGANTNPIQLTAEQSLSVERINDYFNSFQSLRGDFVQTSPKGQSTRGVVLLSKPGKIRFDYAPPVPLLIVSDGKWLTIKNKAKEKGDQVPLASTPLRLVVAPKIDLLSETNVLSFEEADGITSLALADKKGSLGGYLVLIFDNVKNELQQWIIVDGKGRRTTVEFANLEKDVTIDPKMFAVTIKRKELDNK